MKYIKILYRKKTTLVLVFISPRSFLHEEKERTRAQRRIEEWEGKRYTVNMCVAS